jgi:colanic acid biosynthesis protein WcaH
MTQDDWIPDEQWATIVEAVPIVSVDLVIRRENRIALGKRRNNPARGEWFVPGGRLKKGEQLETAVHRVAHEETGLNIKIMQQLGGYEHHYTVSDIDGVDKHYIPIGFVVAAPTGALATDTQHADLRWFEPPFESIDLHPYVRKYLVDAGLLAVE